MCVGVEVIIEVSRPVCGPLAAIAQHMEVIHPDARTKPPTPKTKQTNAGEEKPFPLNPGIFSQYSGSLLRNMYC